MLTAIGRAAARRVLLPGRTTASRLAQLPHGSVIYYRLSGASISAVARPFTVSAWVREPAKRSGTGTAKKTSAATTKKTKTTTATKKKKAKKPAATKKKAKKVLTPEEKSKAELRDLKKMALLKRPTLLPESAWAVYVSDNITAGPGKLTEKIKEVANTFAGLSESEKEGLKSIAQSNANSNKTSRQDWVNSHPVEAIYMANIARRRLARKLDKSRLYLIHDERLPKRALTPYALFIKSRFSQANSESSTGTAQDTFRAISQEWRSMSESEKQPFKEAAAVESDRSQTQLKELKEKAKEYWKAQEGKASQVPS